MESNQSGCFPRSPSTPVSKLVADNFDLPLDDGVLFGDSIKLWTVSRYLANTDFKEGGYLGVYEKDDGTAARVAIPPMGKGATGQFEESVFRIADPRGERADGSPVRYGDVVLLVDKKGLVWNNKCSTSSFTGFFEGYLGPKPRGSNGEVYVSFQKNAHEMKEIGYGDIGVYIDVEASHRHRNAFNYRLTNFRSANSRVIGGYLCSDNTGYEVSFQIHRHTGPPVQAYQVPKLTLQKRRNTLVHNIYVPPRIKSVGVLRDIDRKAGTVDIMIRDPLYGKLIKIFNVLPEDDIVLELDQDTNLFILEADQLFKIAENARSQTNGAAPFVLNVTPERNAKGKRSDLKMLELLIEHDASSLSRMFPVESIEDDIVKSFGKLDLLIACHKLGLVYFTCSVILPYLFCQCFLVLSRFLEPLSDMSWSNKSIGFVVQLLSTLLGDLGVVVEVDGRIIISEEYENFEPGSYVATTLGLFMCYALGFITPDFAFGPVGVQAAQPDNGTHWLLSVEVPEDVPPQESDDEADMDGEDDSVNDVVLRGTWGDAGVDEEGIPKHPAFPRFLNGEKGVVDKAIERWIRTCDWRSEGHIDLILEEPHPFFHLIRENMPSFYYGRAKNGCPVYIDCPGGVKMKALKKAGVGLSDLMFNFIYSTEFLWKVIEPSEQARIVSIMDLEGIGMFDFVGEVIDYVKKTVSISGEHYPERSHKMFIINAPRFFTGVWAIIKPMLDETTKSKIKILRNKYTAELLEVIDEQVLPVKYGGKNTTPLGQSEEDRLLESHACRILLEKNVAMIGPDGKPVDKSPDNLQQYIDTSLVGGVSKINLQMLYPNREKNEDMSTEETINI